MKRLPIKMRIKLAFLFVFALILSLFYPSAPIKTASAATQSRAECVLELSSLRILHGLNAEERLPMASTTKILTAILVIDDCDLDDRFSIPKQAEGVEGSSVYLRAGDEYTVRELLYGLMLRSGNDCAVSLALHHSGSVEKFAQAMNEKALSLGAEHSRFTNPHGLPDDGHYTTARDLALISAYALQNDTFREIVSCKFYEPRGWANKNKMLTEYEGALGVKTGFTMRAGRCLVSGAQRDGMTLVCVVLNSPQMFERSAELLDCAFGEYRLTRLCSGQERYAGFACRFDFDYPLKESEANMVRVETELCPDLPQQIGDYAGIMKIYLENHLLFSQNLYMI